MKNGLTLLGSFWLSLRWTTGPGWVFRSLNTQTQHCRSASRSSSTKDLF